MRLSTHNMFTAGCVPQAVRPTTQQVEFIMGIGTKAPKQVVYPSYIQPAKSVLSFGFPYPTGTNLGISPHHQLASDNIAPLQAARSTLL